jgi:predicted nucleic acid-binding protein
MNIVADASVLLDAFLNHPRVAPRILDVELHAPASVDSEVLHGLRRLWLQGVVSSARATSVLLLLRQTLIVRHPITVYVERMWSLRRNITSYDAAYVALAESFDMPLLTRGARLSRSSGHSARIEYIA